LEIPDLILFYPYQKVNSFLQLPEKGKNKFFINREQVRNFDLKEKGSDSSPY
jgi:hypothetical protein